VLAVEPDPQNAAMCSRNLAPYGDRARVVNVAAWSPPVGLKLKLVRGEFRDGKEWSTQVRAARSGEIPDVEALDMPSLLRMCPRSIVDILKVDIEGAESILFGEGSAAWLGCVRNLCVESHSEEAAAIIEHALEAFRFESCQSGEYSVYLRLAPSAAGEIDQNGA
jgi:FkbM family methyltransferase